MMATMHGVVVISFIIELTTGVCQMQTAVLQTLRTLQLWPSSVPGPSAKGLKKMFTLFRLVGTLGAIVFLFINLMPAVLFTV